MLFLAPGASGPEVITAITGKKPVYSAPGGQQREDFIRVRDFIAAAKVERAASADRIASVDACLFSCRYSPDTMHPSPRKLLDKNDL
jgi:hypothetical protein